MSTSVPKALPGKLSIKIHSPSILYVCLPSELAIIRDNGKAKMDFRHNSTTTLFLFINKTDVTHLMNENQNLHVLIFIQYNRKNEFWVKILFYTKK